MDILSIRKNITNSADIAFPQMNDIYPLSTNLIIHLRKSPSGSRRVYEDEVLHLERC